MLLPACSMRCLFHKGTQNARKLLGAWHQSNDVWGGDKEGWVLGIQMPDARLLTPNLCLCWEAHTPGVRWKQLINRKEDLEIPGGTLIQEDTRPIWAQVVLKIPAMFTLYECLLDAYYATPFINIILHAHTHSQPLNLLLAFLPSTNHCLMILPRYFIFLFSVSPTRL